MTFPASGISFVALATLATVAMIGLGFFTRPSRATGLWSLAFAIAMVSSYASLAAEAHGSLTLRALAAGFVLPAVALLWSGFRAHRGARRPLTSVAIAYLVVSTGALVATAHTEHYAIAFRIDFVGAAVFSCLIVIELLRADSPTRDELLPLLLASGAFPVVAVAGLIDGISNAFAGASAADELVWMREVNGVASGVYLVCALITLLLIVRRSPRSAQGPQAGFDRIVPARLARARETADVRWSLLDIRLDDPDDLRRAFGGERFERVASRFADAVTASLPADADVRRDSPTSFTVLVPRRREALRQLAADLLERVSRVDESRPMPVRISASIGWAETEVLGHDLDDLCAAAAAANLEARNLGGDRWARASPPETAL